MSIEVTMAQIRKIAAAADEEEIPDTKTVEIGIPSVAEFSWGDDEDVIAVREPQTAEEIKRRKQGDVLFLLDGEGRRL